MEELSSEMLTAIRATSYLLLGFLVANFLMLWLVNFPDPHVRMYTWRLISATVSIYLAVMLNQAASSAMLNVFLHKDRPEEDFEDLPDLAVEFVLEVLFFLFCFAAINAAAYLLHRAKRARWSFACLAIGAHITAFAGIAAYSAFSALAGGTWVWTAMALGLVALVGLRALGDRLRNQFLQWEGDEDPRWLKEVHEAEDEACSILASYMIQCTLVYAAVQKRGDVFGHTKKDVRRLLFSEVLVFLVFLCTVCLMWRLPGWLRLRSGAELHERGQDVGHRRSRTDASWARARLAQCGQMALAMSLSWIGLEDLFWVVARHFPQIGTQFVQISSAFILTLGAIVGIILLDCAADRVYPDALAAAKRASKSTEESRRARRRAVAAAEVRALTGLSNPGSQRVVMASEEEPPILEPILDVEEDRELLIAKEELAKIEKFIRMLIDTFALAVGLSWEHAFHAALTTIIEASPWMEQHFVISKCTLAFGSCALMFPAWLSFIVPPARKTVGFWAERIRDEADDEHNEDSEGESSGSEEGR